MKKVCLICEGSYPYVIGGVSSWVNQIITMNSEYNFTIITLVPSDNFATIRYEIPSNVIEIKKIILNDFTLPKFVDKNRFEDDVIIKEYIKLLLDFNKLTSEKLLEIIEYFSRYTEEEQVKISLSHNFWEAILEYYEEMKYEKGLNEYYWIYKNLFLNIISLGNVEIPDAQFYHSVSTGYAGLLLAIIKYRKKNKALITEHGIYFREREEDIVSSKWISDDFKKEWINFFSVICSAAYDYSDKVISLFKYNADYALSRGLDEKKLEIIPNGIDVEEYSKIKREKKEVFSIGSVLRVVPIKDVKMMIKAFKLVLKKEEKMHLYLIGPTTENEKYYEECLELVEDLKLENKVTFTGKADVKEYYKFLDIFLLSSISEGQPLSILEALATGIPCISTNVGNCKEILKEKHSIGEAGIIVPATSYEKMADAILELYGNEERRKKMSKNGSEIVKKYYSSNEFKTNYKRIYKELSER